MTFRTINDEYCYVAMYVHTYGTAQFTQVYHMRVSLFLHVPEFAFVGIHTCQSITVMSQVTLLLSQIFIQVSVWLA